MSAQVGDDLHPDFRFRRFRATFAFPDGRSWRIASSLFQTFRVRRIGLRAVIADWGPTLAFIAVLFGSVLSGMC